MLCRLRFRARQGGGSPRPWGPRQERPAPQPHLRILSYERDLWGVTASRQTVVPDCRRDGGKGRRHVRPHKISDKTSKGWLTRYAARACGHVVWACGHGRVHVCETAAVCAGAHLGWLSRPGWVEGKGHGELKAALRVADHIVVQRMALRAGIKVSLFYRNTYARCQAYVQGTLASTRHRGGSAGGREGGRASWSSGEGLG
jgi:hypothetical protein